MNITALLAIARDKSNFRSVSKYIDFCDRFVSNIDKSIHCKIVSCAGWGCADSPLKSHIRVRT